VRAVAARLDAGAPTLRPGDWNSGALIRIVDLIAPFGGREEMEREFREAVR
jgi:hemolysin-activating ACP:hemolysin acyltransferase